MGTISDPPIARVMSPPTIAAAEHKPVLSSKTADMAAHNPPLVLCRRKAATKNENLGCGLQLQPTLGIFLIEISPIFWKIRAQNLRFSRRSSPLHIVFAHNMWYIGRADDQ
jgi:hypothetical protein